MHIGQRYEAYKNSGIDWLGEVPAHWKIKRVKDELESLDYKRIPLSGEERGKMNNPTYDYYGASGAIDRVDKYIFDEPTILIGEDGANLLNRNTPLAFIARGKYWVNNHAHILKPKKGNIEFFCNQLESFDYTTRISGSAQPKFTAGQLSRVFLMVPPLPEQTAIADYLDRHTGLIDRKIGLLRRKAARYGSLKQALINETVTRGLDAAAPLKDSGVEWIGQIPKHWEVKRLKEINLIIMGQSPSSSDYTEQGLGYPFLQGNAEFGHYSPTPKVWCSAIKKFAIKNDVLLSVRAPVGAVNVATDSYGIGRGLCAIRSKSNYKFWYYFLTTISAYLNSIATGSTYSAVSIDDVKNTMTPLPTEQEQTAIAAYLDEKTAQIDRIVSAINAQIEKLAELRKTLINDVVTGKIKIC